MNSDVIAFSPHPDDVELGCGGTVIQLIDQGYRVGLVEVTSAKLSTAGDPLIRDKEAQNSHKVMGINDRIQMNMSEGALGPTNKNVYKIVKLIREKRPYIVLAPYPEDRHPDHSDVGKLIQAACFWSGVSKFGDNLPPHRPHRIINYFLHWEGPVSFIVDITSSFDRKLSAIRSYHSQFLTLPGDRAMTYISRPEFLEKIINRASYYGSRIGAEYGEPFFVKEITRIDNLMTWAEMQGIIG